MIDYVAQDCLLCADMCTCVWAGMNTGSSSKSSSNTSWHRQSQDLHDADFGGGMLHFDKFFTPCTRSKTFDRQHPA
jgi:hypothetical protein